MNWKNVGKTILLVAGGAIVNYLLTIIPGVHFSAQWDPIITSVGATALHALQEWITAQSSKTPTV